MVMTRLQLINNVLSLVGETPLLDSAGTLGTLTANVINTAIFNVASETRANVFEQVVAANVTAPDYLTAATTLPANTIQVYSVLLRVSTGLAAGDKLFPLDYLPLESTPAEPSYSIVGSDVFVSPMVARPFTLRIHTIVAPTLPALDSTDSGLPDVVIPVVSHVAASILALSYLDDANQSSLHRNIGEQLVDKLRRQYGNNRAKSFNIAGSRAATNFGYGGVSSITGGVAYAPLDSPALTGNPTAPTQPTADNDTSIATTAYVQNNLVNYLTTASASSTYLSQASAAANYLTIAAAASTYVSAAFVAATYAPLASPTFTGTPNSTTPVWGSNNTQIATTAFLVNANTPKVRANRTSNQTPVTNNTFTTVIFNNETLDTDNAYNPATGEFTVPAGRGGDYRIQVSVGVQTNAGTNAFADVGIAYFVNGTQVSLPISAGAPVTAYTWNYNCTEVLTLAAGDVLTVRVNGRHTGTTPSIAFVATTTAPCRLSITRVV